MSLLEWLDLWAPFDRLLIRSAAFGRDVIVFGQRTAVPGWFVDGIIAQRRKAYSIEEIAEQLGEDVLTTLSLLRAIERRKVAPHPNERKQWVAPDEARQIKAFYGMGMTINRISEVMSICYENVRTILDTVSPQDVNTDQT